MLSDFLHPETAAEALEMWMDLMVDPGGSRTGRQRIVRRDRAEMWVEATVMNRYDRAGEGLISALMYDIAGRRAQEQELESTRGEFRLLAEEMPTTVFRADEQGRVTFANRRWDVLVESLGLTLPFALRDVIHPEDRASFDQRFEALATVPAARASPSRSRCRRTVGAGHQLPLHRGTGGVGACGDRLHPGRHRHRRAAPPAARRPGDRDPEPGGDRRRAGAGADGRSGGHRGAVPRPRRFKSVNDRHGHDVGDLVLREVARRLGDAVRPTDIVGRYGGDEFVVICHEAAGPSAESGIAARITASLDAPVVWPGGSWAPATSIGMARPEPGEDAAQILRRADLAMFDHKRRRKAGRGIVRSAPRAQPGIEPLPA